MALRDYKAPKETVTFEGGCFDIRGISFSNLSVLIREHFSDLEMVYKILMESETGDGEIDFQSVIAAVVSNCPQLIARIICISADEDDEQGYDAAYNLSFPIQIDIVARIVKLSFYEVGGVKKFISEMSAKLQLASQKAIQKK